MNAVAKYESYEKKLQGICDENNLVYTISKRSNPFMLVVRPSSERYDQTSLVDAKDQKTYTSEDASLCIFYRESGDEKPSYKFSNDFAMGEALLGKLKNLFANLHKQYMRFFFDEIMTKGIIAADKLPTIESTEASVPDDLPDGAQPLEELDGEE